jgi:hypothetical protein
MKDPLLIAIDPGVVTGLAFWYPDGGELPLMFEDPEDEAVDRVESWLDERDGPQKRANTLVICEDFKPRGGALTWFPNSLHQIGHFLHECRQRGIAFRLQTPADGKRFSTDAKLRRVGWYDTAIAAFRPDITSHTQAVDAARHLLLASVKIGVLNGDDLL